ncbi:acyl-CoA dehydrogenase family protein [Phenylobacterium sp. Root700]|uniref:acyl-CoA dehydrogenase family protein n=1 Tax=Phenylobacterium sp. Root700 TaxID=1736591 RepID=UPI0006F5FF76|nr:acyl-CoA dehydrogenase [Phenylobacterium sp. Root700]KRB40965.1 pimeloyl-CoA dehydrogenase small subunit [Phenylobacterium sp. Root700]
MDFNPTDDQRMLADTLRRFVAERYPLEARTRLSGAAPGYSTQAWRQLAELGALGALFDPELGGYGGGPDDIAAVFEALGSGAVAGPFLASLLSGSCLASVGGEQAEALLQAIIAGDAVIAFAHQEPGSRYELGRVETTAAAGAGGWRLSGAKAVVSYGDAADQFIVSARTSGAPDDEQGVSLFLVPAGAPGLSIRGYVGVDGARSAEVLLDQVEVGADRLLGVAGGAFEVIEKATGAGVVALCADGVGALDVVKDMTAEYLRTRKQFGQPIGSFQALQHRMATVLIEIEQARSALTNAVAAFGGPRVSRERALSAAKYTLGRVAALVAEEAVQLHGGIGMTWELPLSHYVKRLIMLDHLLGDVDHHLERYIALGRAA